MSRKRDVKHSNHPQDESFEIMGRPAIDRLLRGYNVTIFAFGQTGTGKTHTMFGWTPPPDPIESAEDDDGKESVDDAVADSIVFSPEELYRGKGGDSECDAVPRSIDSEHDGLIPRIVEGLFAALRGDDDVAYFSVDCGFIEVYQERLRDLLRPRLRVQLRYVGMGSELINLSWHSVASYDEMANLMETATANRVTATTKMNATSSRSHCVVVLKLELTLRDGTSQSNQMSLCDLAGSEKVECPQIHCVLSFCAMASL